MRREDVDVQSLPEDPCPTDSFVDQPLRELFQSGKANPSVRKLLIPIYLNKVFAMFLFKGYEVDFGDLVATEDAEAAAVHGPLELGRRTIMK